VRQSGHRLVQNKLFKQQQGRTKGAPLCGK
jgi:hypothetical protein